MNHTLTIYFSIDTLRKFIPNFPPRSRLSIQQGHIDSAQTHDTIAVFIILHETPAQDFNAQLILRLRMRNAVPELISPTSSNRPKSSFTLLNSRHRAGQDSVAVDAWDKDESDQETDSGEDDQEATITDLVPSQDKDDEGLHHGIARLKLNPPKPVHLVLRGPRKRQRDEEGEGESSNSNGGGLKGDENVDGEGNASRAGGGDGDIMDAAQGSGGPTKICNIPRRRRKRNKAQ